jgi:hypothetical protein
MITAALRQSIKQVRQMLPYTIYRAIQSFSLLVVLVLGLLVGSRVLSSKSHYPLESYEEIQPGNPATILENYGCHTSTAASFSEMQSCQITPHESAIQYIQVSINHEIIQSVLFSINGLSLGLLSLRWGRPAFVRVNEGFFVARWESGMYARGHLNGEFSYATPVQILSFAG